MRLQVPEGEFIEDLRPDGAFEDGKIFAKTLEQAGIVGVCIDRQAVVRTEPARPPDHLFQLFPAQVNEPPGLFGFNCFVDATGMGDDGLKPLLNNVEIAAGDPMKSSGK